jgi:hypothetical protein
MAHSAEERDRITVEIAYAVVVSTGFVIGAIVAATWVGRDIGIRPGHVIATSFIVASSAAMLLAPFRLVRLSGRCSGRRA